MKCKACNSVLCQRNHAGEPIIRTRGIVRKPGGYVLVCPRCKAGVPVANDFLKAFEAAVITLPVPCAGTLRALRARS
jgi:hypothetical protein